MVLLHSLKQLSGAHGWTLTVAHLNHRLRGRSSDADERLVSSVAKKFSLRLVTACADTRAYSTRHKLSIELAARKLRHEFLARTARRLRINTIALAHHSDDQLELFFLRLLRGTGGEGLAGMKWQSPSPSDPTIRLIRPMLDISKDELREFAAGHKIPFREDATNAHLDFRRNRVRHELLPLLRRHYQPALGKTIPRIAEIVGAESDLAKQLATEWLQNQPRSSRGTEAQTRKLSRGLKPALPIESDFSDLPIAVQRWCVRLQVRDLGITEEFDLIEHLRLNLGKSVSCPRPLSENLQSKFQASIACSADGRISLNSTFRPAFESAEKPLRLALTRKTTFSDLRIRWQLISEPGAQRPRPHPGQEFFDADAVGAHITLRHWRAGDRFQPLGMKSSVKLQDLFTNLKVPRAERHHRLVAVTKSGCIFWVQGLRIGHGFELKPSTRARLRWTWRVNPRHKP